MGVLAHHQGDLTRARTRTEESLRVLREAGNTYATCQNLAVLGRIALQQSDYAVARAALIEAVSLARRLGNTFGLFLALEGLAGLDAIQGEPLRGLRLAGAVHAAREATGTTMASHWQTTTARWLDVARARLSERAAGAAWTQGLRIPLEQAIDEALAAPAISSPRREQSGLTKRQWEIAALVAEGLTNRQIAECFVVSERTIDGHLERIRNRLGVRGRAQIAAWFVGARGTSTLPLSPKHL
jgi:DNA-binding CsgD family transcriptional regulator